jgi:TRAP-type C4-dicarboxylate transport system permease small subunit
MKLLERINSYLEKIESTLLIIIVSVMVVLAFLQVVLRNLFAQGILWADIFLRHLVLWVGFIGASLATREEKHIVIDLFTRFLSKRKKNIARVITNLFAFIICLFLADAGWTFVQYEKSGGTILFNNIQAWYFQIIIPIGFLLMAFRFLLLSLNYLQRVIKE